MTNEAETWHLTKHLERKLRSVLQAMERKMIGVMLRERKQASWIKEQTRVEDIQEDWLPRELAEEEG